MVPPSIVELSSNKVVLSWRATLGQCSIRTVSERSTDSLEWANLEEDTERRADKKKHDAARGVVPAVKANAVQVLEVDHIELQTCSGCTLCILGEKDDEEEEDVEEHRCGLDCWRPVYEGPDSRCQVNLGRGNAIHYFRLLVRATLPPPTRRGYMRPKLAGLVSTEAGTSCDSSGGTFGVIPSPDRSSPSRRRRRQRNQHQPEVDVANCSISNGKPPTSNSDVARTSSREKGRAASSATTPSGTRTITAAGDGVRWFASDSVFVDSRPPPVTLHGIGTALVLTWPAYAGLSGAEQVSYILEQWSYAVNSSTSPPKWGTQAEAAAATGSSAGPEDNCDLDQNSPLEFKSRQWHRRRHHTHLPPPKQVDAKEIFSVGTRCWYMPTCLQTGRCYWYRLGLIHEGGKSVGGPWVSHLTCVAPPWCIDVGSRDLVLSFPRAIGNAAWSGLRSDNKKGNTASRQTDASISSADKQLQRVQPSAMMVDNTECLAAGELEMQTGGEKSSCMDGEEKECSEAEQGEGEKGQGQDECEEEVETPMVWYTLEGFTKRLGWNILYRGPAPEVKIEVRGHKGTAELIAV